MYDVSRQDIQEKVKAGSYAHIRSFLNDIDKLHRSVAMVMVIK